MLTIMLGVIASVLPNYIFKVVYFGGGQQSAQQLVKRLYLAVILKFTSLLLLLTFILAFFKPEVLSLILAFVLAELSCKLYWGYKALGVRPNECRP